ncbi:NACHT domain-containing protein [Streptomyces sp. NBC_00075]|uniref:NACHT domain-containing protein n=1 Tax=Streptomyces sp. NBC_00075 TaxID=2975641 RepID=UPI00324B54F5
MGGGTRDELVELKAQLRQLRAERRLSMSGLELRARLGHTTASRALNGSTVPSEATVVALARALGTDAAPLLALRRKAVPSAPALIRAPAGKDTDDGADAQFEERYRQYVEHRHAQMSVIGLALSQPGRASWPLDTSYLSLELALRAPGPGPEARSDAPAITWKFDLAGIPAEVRAEQALAGRRRTLVRGLAGGGKTTLLQWLAVTAARQDLPDELAHLADCVPFVLPLRTLVRRGDLPGPQDYLAAVGCPLHGVQLAGWTDRVLAGGRALLLIDGLDEIPQEQRARARQWLQELLAAYPQSTYIVTTRPAAVPEGWLAEYEFAELTIRPMSARDVSVFIARWHAAAATDAGTAEEHSYLASLEEALRDTVRSQHDLAQLATTPLLCALVCALNRDRRGHLPHGRMELYEAALSMLLIRRDRERDIDAPESLVLTEHQSVQLLQRLAYWLIRNGQTEMDHGTATGLIEDALPAMPLLAQQSGPAGVLAHLLARSGLLRTPAADTIDFVHRTFQDFLGAKAALEARDIPLLVRNAHDDQWEDVVRMAVAHARPQERVTLLRRLIARGDRTAKHRTRLHVLAAACLEYATELDPGMRREVEQRAAALVPPRSEDEAAMLALAGPVILHILPGPDGLDDDEVAAVVHTAELIGGNGALALLKKFRTCRPAQWALSNAWKSFDTHDYAREILAHIPDLSAVTVRTQEELRELHSLQPLEKVAFIGDFSDTEMTAPLAKEDLKALNIDRNTVVRGLDFLRPYPAVTHLGLFKCPNISDLRPLAEGSLLALEINGCESVRIDDLKELVELDVLSLDVELPERTLGALPVDADLTWLALGPSACKQLSMDGITRWPNLTRLDLSGPLHDFARITELAKLQDLILLDNADLSMLKQLPQVPQITELWLSKWSTDDDLALVRNKLPNLTSLTIWAHGACRRVDLTPLRGMSGLAIRIHEADEILGAEHFPPGNVTRTPRPRAG